MGASTSSSRIRSCVVLLLLLLVLCSSVTPASARLLSSLLRRVTAGSPSLSPSSALDISASLLSDGSLLYNGVRYAPLPLSSSSSLSLTDDPAPDCEDTDALITPSQPTFFLYLGVCASLVLVGGLVSGLTIGLFSLSNLELEVLQEDMEAEPADRRRAKRLEPLLREERHHLLLVTLLLTNTAAMEALPEVLDKIVPEWAAVLISVSLVLLFSEIIPQSICTRAPLAVGAFFSPLVWLLMFVLYPVSWPIAKVLDCCIGKEGGTQFLASRSQVTSLLEIIKRHNVLTVEEAKIMQTVVQLRNKQIKDVMIPPQDIYMLSMDDRLSATKLREILQAGHSRIPVYRGTSRNNIQGVLLTKRLIVVRPEDEEPVSKYADYRPVWVKVAFRHTPSRPAPLPSSCPHVVLPLVRFCSPAAVHGHLLSVGRVPARAEPPGHRVRAPARRGDEVPRGRGPQSRHRRVRSGDVRGPHRGRVGR